MIIRTITPPAGSAITVSTDGAAPVISIPQPRGGASGAFTGLFLLFWLGGWAVGWWTVLSKLLSGEASPFLVFWFGGWTIGGGFVMWTLYRMVRPSVPEMLTLAADGVAYDSGVPPFQQSMFTTHRNDFWKSAFRKRTVVAVRRQDLRSLRLRETDTGNRLTVDVDSKRVDLANAASEVEREWLYRVLAERYGVAG